jgi:hypothetical protein
MCEELEIGFAAFTPLGAGFLAGKIDTTTKFDAKDSGGENTEPNKTCLSMAFSEATRTARRLETVSLAPVSRPEMMFCRPSDELRLVPEVPASAASKARYCQRPRRVEEARATIAARADDPPSLA